LEASNPREQAGLSAGEARGHLESFLSAGSEFAQWLGTVEQAERDTGQDEEQMKKVNELNALGERAVGVVKGVATLQTEFDAVINGVGDALGDPLIPPVGEDEPPPPEM
jgi:hypothetical protein